MKTWSKTTRICVMMALDSVFLAVELGVGYYVQSLALIADAFHMLNDIISLAVGLWAVTLARKESNDRYSYGWLRAEILGAFFNATFLIGLCVTIVLEAIQRFFEPPNIRSPEVVLVVGCFGLVSNLVGFWVLGGHGHSHGGHDEEDVEVGHDHSHGHEHHPHAHEELDGSSDVEEAICNHPDEEEGDEETTVSPAVDQAQDIAGDTSRTSRVSNPELVRHVTFSSLNSHERSVSHSSARSRGAAGLRARGNSIRRVPTSIDDISIHPASFRNEIREIIEASQIRSLEDDEGDSGDTTTADESATPVYTSSAPTFSTETTPLLGKTPRQFNGPIAEDDVNGDRDSPSDSYDHHTHPHHHFGLRTRRDSHGGHHHNEPRDPAQAHGHSHGEMGMNAMILHVMGDALGNIGVIVTALIIWKTNWAYRMYADPFVSLLITIIILHSAIPLTKATSKILLQATPDHISLNDIREDLQDLDGVISCHHIHVWQLSDSQIVASLHIEVTFPISESGGEKYMKLARRVRKCLHGYGIHSATIQPEFRLDEASTLLLADDTFSTSGAGASTHRPRWATAGGDLASNSASSATTATATATFATAAPADSTGGPSCLLDCVANCTGKGCCSVTSRTTSRTGSPPSGHEH